jgi:lipopolysaccharide biosynthesis protein
LAARIGIGTFQTANHINFPAGSMFWGRTRAFQPLLDLNLSWEDYPAEPVGHDGSMLHALERMMPVIARHSGFHVAVTHVQGVRR